MVKMFDALQDDDTGSPGKIALYVGRVGQGSGLYHTPQTLRIACGCHTIILHVSPNLVEGMHGAGVIAM